MFRHSTKRLPAGHLIIKWHLRVSLLESFPRFLPGSCSMLVPRAQVRLTASPRQRLLFACLRPLQTRISTVLVTILLFLLLELGIFPAKWWRGLTTGVTYSLCHMSHNADALLPLTIITSLFSPLHSEAVHAGQLGGGPILTEQSVSHGDLGISRNKINEAVWSISGPKDKWWPDSWSLH